MISHPLCHVIYSLLRSAVGMTHVLQSRLVMDYTTSLHSEIDQIHRSIEAQCVTTLLPMGDCHIVQSVISCSMFHVYVTSLTATYVLKANLVLEHSIDIALL